MSNSAVESPAATDCRPSPAQSTTKKLAEAVGLGTLEALPAAAGGTAVSAMVAPFCTIW